MNINFIFKVYFILLVTLIFLSFNISNSYAFESSEQKLILSEINQPPYSSQTDNINNQIVSEILVQENSNLYDNYVNYPHEEFNESIYYIVVDTYKTGKKIGYKLTDLIINSLTK